MGQAAMAACAISKTLSEKNLKASLSTHLTKLVWTFTMVTTVSPSTMNFATHETLTRPSVNMLSLSLQSLQSRTLKLNVNRLTKETHAATELASLKHSF